MTDTRDDRLAGAPVEPRDRAGEEPGGTTGGGRGRAPAPPLDRTSREPAEGGDLGLPGAEKAASTPEDEREYAGRLAAGGPGAHGQRGADR